jgi:carbon-monoxide dehydrogenase medium subunit
LIGSVQMRNQATLIGNLCTASPAGDTIPGLIVHDASIEIAASSGDRRRVDIASFITGPGQTILKPDELVTSLYLLPLAEGESSAFQRFTQREALDLAFASVAARLAYESDGQTIRKARLALGAVDASVIEAPEAAAMLTGNPLDDAVLRECAEAAAQACSPISDLRASADYRRQLIKALVIDVVTEAARRAHLE